VRSVLIPLGISCGAYLLGCVSSARLVGRRVAPGHDLAATDLPVPGSRETWTYRGVSATSLIGRGKIGGGLLVILLDALKALVPTLAVYLAWPDRSLHLLAAAAVMTGHVYPVWHRFRGGRGQACLLGAMLVINPLVIPLGLIAGALVGLLVLTSGYAARDGSVFFLVPWYAVGQGWGPGLWFSMWVCTVYALAIVPDVREEVRVRHALGTFSLGYGRRLRVAWRDLTDRTAV